MPDVFGVYGVIRSERDDPASRAGVADSPHCLVVPGRLHLGRHNVMGQDAGLSKEEVSRVTSGPDAAGWSEFDTALLRAADDLHTSRFVSDETWNTLAQRYSESQLREVVLIVGNYTQLSMFHNTLGAQLEPDVAGLPDEAR